MGRWTRSRLLCNSILVAGGDARAAVCVAMATPDELIATLRACRLPREADVRALCASVRDVFMSEPNLLTVERPVTVRQRGGRGGGGRSKS